MADSDNSEAFSQISTQDMLDELNLDSTEENNKLMSGLIQDSALIIIHAVNNNLSASEVNSDKIFNRAVKALATQLYFDRTLSQGMSLGIQLMIDHLKGEYAEWPADQQN